MLTHDDFCRLVSDAHARAWVVAVSVTNNRSVADDVVQDAVMIAWRKRGDFMTGSSFSAWFSEIARRCALNEFRKSKSRKTRSVDPNSMSHVESADVDEGIRPAVDREGTWDELQTDFDDELCEALQQLKEEARSCLLLRVVQQLSYAEIAKTLKIPEGTAMSHVCRSKRLLRAHYYRRATNESK